MTRVVTGSRLHFGLFNAGATDRGGRRFGGVGLMIAQPAVDVSAEPAPEWEGNGRALDFARCFAQSGDVSPHRIVVRTSPSEHVGLGTGTQLGLAVAAALDRNSLPVEELARRVGRGCRSAIGLHGFARGGLIVEAGRRGDDVPGTLVVRAAFPRDWRIVLVRPARGGAAGLHGEAERRAFAAPGDGHAADLSRLVLLEMLPALAEGDCRGFGKALHQFNRRAGEPFAAAQGGVYASPRLAEVVEWLRGRGVEGVGQSSWGPTLFAVVADADEAARLAERARAQFDLPFDAVSVTAARNEPASVSRGCQSSTESPS